MWTALFSALISLMRVLFLDKLLSKPKVTATESGDVPVALRVSVGSSLHSKLRNRGLREGGTGPSDSVG